MVFNDCIDSFRDIPSIIKHTSNYYPQSNNCKKKKNSLIKPIQKPINDGARDKNNVCKDDLL